MIQIGCGGWGGGGANLHIDKSQFNIVNYLFYMAIWKIWF